MAFPFFAMNCLACSDETMEQAERIKDYESEEEEEKEEDKKKM